jgi:protoheme IX farnesyltransferase
MKRTQNRPLPTGRLQPEQALCFGVVLSVVGILILAFFVNLLTSFLAVITLTTYLFVYTPLKKRSPLCTLVGAIPGAIPPLIGWTAVRGELGLEAWILFSILFLWQLPHFLAIGWVCREEYARAGFPMLMALDTDGRSTARQILLYCLALLPTTLIPSILRMSGVVYFCAALFLGAVLAGFGLFLYLSKEKDFHARKFFLTTILYLFVLTIFMMGDKI